MRRHFLLLLCVFLVSIHFAQENEKTLIAKEGLFWKISSPNSDFTSYIFGTIHLIDRDKYVLPKAVSKRIEKADLLVMEIAEMDNSFQSMQLMMLEKGSMTDILSQSQKDSLYKYVQANYGMDSTLFEKTMGKFKPFTFLQLPFATIYSQSESYDLNIHRLAKENKIPVLGLETTQDQLGFFDNLTDEIKSEMMMQVVRDTCDLKSEWSKFQNLYLNQQISDLYYFDKGNTDITTFYDKTLLSERNKNWMNILKPELLQKSIFIAVGAGHLAGENGLLSLLEMEGFLVTPIQIKLN